MIESFYVVLFPGAPDILCLVQVGLSRIIGHKADVKNTLMKPQTSRPHALTVYVFLSGQRLPRRAVQPVINIGHMLPMCQVIGPQDLAPRHKMHGGAHHIIGIPHPDHIRVRIVQPGNRISHLRLHFHTGKPGLPRSQVGFPDDGAGPVNQDFLHHHTGVQGAQRDLLQTRRKRKNRTGPPFLIQRCAGPSAVTRISCPEIPRNHLQPHRAAFSSFQHQANAPAIYQGIRGRRQNIHLVLPGLLQEKAICYLRPFFLLSKYSG